MNRFVGWQYAVFVLVSLLGKVMDLKEHPQSREGKNIFLLLHEEEVK